MSVLLEKYYYFYCGLYITDQDNDHLHRINKIRGFVAMCNCYSLSRRSDIVV